MADEVKTTEEKPKKTLEERRKEVWAAGQMDPAILAWNGKHKEGFIPDNTDQAYKEFYKKDIMDETPPPVVCGWCEKTKGNTDTDCQCGRPTKFSEDIIRKAKNYLESCEDEIEEFHKTRGEKSDSYERIVKANIPNIGGLADYLDVSRQRMYEWEKEFPMFRDILEKLRVKQENVLIKKGSSGEYNPTIAKLLLAKHGYRDSIENLNVEVPVDPEAKARADAAINEFLNKK